MGLENIDWAGFTRPQHRAAFDALLNVHEEVVSRVHVGAGRDNTVLLTLAVDLNAAMRAGDDELVRREQAAVGGDLSALR